MPLYIVNVSTGWKLQEGVPAVPCGEVVELHEEIGEPAVDAGYLIPDYPTPYLTEDHAAKFGKYRVERKPESPARTKKPDPPKGGDRTPANDDPQMPRVARPVVGPGPVTAGTVLTRFDDGEPGVTALVDQVVELDADGRIVGLTPDGTAALLPAEPQTAPGEKKKK